MATARATGLSLAVRGGGHNIAGHGTVEGGIVLDMSHLCEVSVDVDQQLVTVAAGAILADVDAATAPHGLTLDHLAAADLVTAGNHNLVPA